MNEVREAALREQAVEERKNGKNPAAHARAFLFNASHLPHESAEARALLVHAQVHMLDALIAEMQDLRRELRLAREAREARNGAG